MRLADFIIKNWKVFVIVCTVIAVALIVASFVIAVVKVRKIKYVKANSVLYKKLVALNKSMRFNTFQTTHTIRRVYGTRKEFNRANTHDIFLDFIKDI